MIDAWLIADKDAHREQLPTAPRVWQRLVAEHGAVLSEVTVSRYVARRRVELDMVKLEACIPQTHEPGAEAEVDFGEFYATIAGRQRADAVWRGIPGSPTDSVAHGRSEMMGEVTTRGPAQVRLRRATRQDVAGAGISAFADVLVNGL